MENHDEIIKEFKGYFENQSEEINPSFQKSTIINLQKFQEMILENKDLEETALDKKLDKYKFDNDLYNFIDITKYFAKNISKFNID